MDKQTNKQKRQTQEIARKRIKKIEKTCKREVANKVTYGRNRHKTGNQKDKGKRQTDDK